MIDLAAGQDASAVMLLTHLYTHAEHARAEVLKSTATLPMAWPSGCCSRTPSWWATASTCAAGSATP